LEGQTPNMGMYDWDTDSEQWRREQLGQNFKDIDIEFALRGVNINWKDADPSGQSDSSAAILAAIADDDSDSIYIPKGLYLISQNVSIPSYKKLIFDRNARLQIANEKTLTLHCTIDANPSDWIFDLSLSGTVKGSLKVKEIYPEWFGAKLDGITDDTLSIQTAFNCAELSEGATVQFPYRKMIKVTMQGVRSTKTWHSGAYKRRFSLLIGSNVDVDFNYCTLSCPLVQEASALVPVNIISNKAASNDLSGNVNIRISNLILDQNVPYLTYDATQVGSYDSVVAEFHNTDGVVLTNITVQNAFGWGLKITNSRHFKVLGKTLLSKIVGCALRIGWDDNTAHGYVEDVEIRNNSNLYESLVAGNTIYCVAEHLRIGRIFQTLDTEYIPTEFNINDIVNYKLGSANFANNCNHINIDEIYCYYLGFKIQNYTGTTAGSPNNIRIGKIYLENTFFNQQAHSCYIDELMMGTNSFVESQNGVYCYINRIMQSRSGRYTLKGIDTKKLYINEIISTDSYAILSTAPNAVIQINNIFISRNDPTMPLDSGTKYLIDLGTCSNVQIWKLVYSIGSSSSVTTNFIKMPAGSSIGSVTGSYTNSSNITTKMIDSFLITLSVGTQTTINLSNNSFGNSDSSVYRNGNFMRRRFDIAPMSNLSRSIVIINSIETQFGDKLVINHSAATGIEQFYVKVLSYDQLPETTTW